MENRIGHVQDTLEKVEHLEKGWETLIKGGQTNTLTNGAERYDLNKLC